MTDPEKKQSFVLENLAECERKQNILDEARLFHLSEWARLVAELCLTEEDALLNLLSPGHPGDPIAIGGDVLPENRPLLRKLYRGRSLYDKLFILRTICERLPMEKWPFPWSDPAEGEFSAEGADGKIAYLQNTYTDAAYLHLSREVAHPRAVYFDRFSDVCEEVYSGLCQYGILPVRHTEGGKLPRFYDMLDKYDLHITAVCHIPKREADRTVYTGFGLISKTLPPLSRLLATHRDTWKLELSVPTDVVLSDLLAAADICRLKLSDIDTHRSQDENETAIESFHLTFDLPQGSDAATFMAYLSMEVPRAGVPGFYRMVK